MEGQTHAPPIHSCSNPSFHVELNLPNLNIPPLRSLPWVFSPDKLTHHQPSLVMLGGGSAPAAWGPCPGGRAGVQHRSPPRRPFPGAGGPPRTAAALGAETARPSTQHGQGCASAEQSQEEADGVTSGHGAGPLRSLRRVGWGFVLFFYPFFHLGYLEV